MAVRTERIAQNPTVRAQPPRRLDTAVAGLLGLAVVLVLPASHATEPLYRGYTILTEAPIAPGLDQTVYLRVRGQKVLEGLRKILHGTGYRLADPAAADPEIGRLYDQPYPDGQREIGPRALGAALERLAGPAWQLVEDPVNRRVSFEVKAAYRSPPAVRGPTGLTADWDRRDR